MERIVEELMMISPRSLVEVQGDGTRKLSRFYENLRRLRAAGEAAASGDHLRIGHAVSHYKVHCSRRCNFLERDGLNIHVYRLMNPQGVAFSC